MHGIENPVMRMLYRRAIMAPEVGTCLTGTIRAETHFTTERERAYQQIAETRNTRFGMAFTTATIHGGNFGGTDSPVGSSIAL
jgi:hypothetical protein